jgi:hypothetical protein
MFFDKYILTKGGFSEPKFRRVAKKSPWNGMESGLYNEGLITVFDLDYNDSFLSSWEWLIGSNIILLGCTCWGDFFYVDMNDGEFYIVLSDQYKKFQMGNSFSAVFDMNLADENFQKDILRPNEFLLFQKEVGVLDYGEFYISSRRTGSKGKKDFSLVLDIIGQKGQQI